MTTVLRSHSELDTLPGGKYRLTQHIRPIAYDKNGSWTRIANLFSTTGDPNFPIGADELLQFRIRDRLVGQSPMFHFGKGNHSLRATLLDTNNTDGIVNGAAILFPNAWNNADFELILAGHKIKGNVYLRSGHPQTYRLRIDESTGFDPATLMLGDVARILPPVLLPPASSPTEQIPLSWVITQQGGKWILAVTLPQGNYVGWVLDPTLTLQPDATDGVDTLIYTGMPTFNWGVAPALSSGLDAADRIRALFKFSLTSIPNDAIVSLSTKTLYCTGEDSATDYGVGLHRALTQWFEGAKDAAAPDAGQDGSTWNLRNANGAVAWAGGAGGGAGSDYAASATATTTITAPAASYDWDVTADVVAFVAGTATNHGWWAINADEITGHTYKTFASSDNATAANRPKLVVEYTLLTANSRVILLRFR